ncbi:MAG TPA: thiamine-phosphate kinase [Gemmatimonadales bacterium]|jgi:thiamine-monophosphate kinase|nr:thiamine-phosphate kinase [Gemmatimonadales bacterium]
MNVPLGEGAEFDRIRTIADALGADARNLGDDCAVLRISDTSVVVSTDASVEHVHFERNWLDLEEIGYRATAAALSDLAGQAAAARGVLVAVAAPESSSADDLASVMRGAGAAARASGTQVLGGDLSRGGEWMLCATVIGVADCPVARRGATAGDGVWVTGALGGARAALEAFRAGRAPDAAARQRFAAPSPRIAAGQWLAAHGAHAMLDLSDGIASDAGHLAAASGVEVEIVLEELPVHPSAVEAALDARGEPVIFAAKGGEDYELLVAMPSSFGMESAAAFERAMDLTLSRIGSCHHGHGVRLLFRGSRLTLKGFNHFS